VPTAACGLACVGTASRAVDGAYACATDLVVAAWSSPLFDRPASCGPMTVHPLVVFIAAEPGLAERLLAVHVDDGSGRCRVCSSGAQSGRNAWPCTIHGLAGRAKELDGDDAGG
jgi:hypothetical protein